MKRLITLGIMLAVVAFVAAPVFAEVQNVKVSGDVNEKGLYREDFSLLPEARLGTNTHNNRLINAARVKVDADLTDNVATCVRLLSEQEWDTEANTGSTGNDIAVDLANVTLKEAFYAPLTAIIGRQELRYGKGFIIGDPDTNTTSVDANIGVGAGDMSLRKSFDAIRLIADYNPWTIEALYTKIDETGTTAQDEDLYGVNAAHKFQKYNGEAEAYALLLKDDTSSSNDPDAASPSIKSAFHPGHEIYTFGLRGSATPLENLNVLGEIAWQRGDYDHLATLKRDQKSMAFQVAGDYTFTKLAWNPVLKAGFTYYSGEENADSGDQGAWIPLFEDQTHGMLANYIFGGINGGQNSNAEILNIGGTVNPLQDLTLTGDFYYFWLDEKLVTTDNTAVGANTAGNPTNNDDLGWYNLDEATTAYYANAEENLGYEIDLGLKYDYTEDVKMGLAAGWFIPGKALEGETSSLRNDETAVQFLATLDVSF